MFRVAKGLVWVPTPSSDRVLIPGFLSPVDGTRMSPKYFLSSEKQHHAQESPWKKVMGLMLEGLRQNNRFL